MTTPNTIKATLTSDVGAAQVNIQRLIKTVEDMGKTVNATSLAGQKAFRAEADEVARLARELGAGEKQLARLTAARSSFAARVTAESNTAAAASQKMAGAYGMATANVTKGLSEIASQGKVTAEKLRDIATGAADLAIAFAPGGILIKGVLLAASAIGGAFFAARNEIKATEKAFSDAVESMRKKADAPGLMDQAFSIDTDLAAARRRLADANDPTGKTMGDVLRLAPERKRLADEVAQLERRAAEVRNAIMNPAEQRAPRNVMGTVTVTANGPTWRPKMTSSTSDGVPDATSNANANPLNAIGNARDWLAAIPTGDNSPLAMIAADAARPVTAMMVLRSEIAKTGSDFKMMGDLARFALEQGIGAGLDALISGQGSAIAALKRTAAEPIVAKLKMNAVEALGDAAKFAMNPTTWALVPAALAAAAKNTLGAVAVARLGGIGGGGGGSNDGGGASGGAAGGRAAGLSGDGLSAQRQQTIRVEMVVVTRTPDGRELSRTRQQIQRLDDRNQPIRVTL